jgi:hypothetical protein
MIKIQINFHVDANFCFLSLSGPALVPSRRHLNVAVPYCDVVISEKFWKSLVERTDILERFDTEFASNLDALVTLAA